MKVLEPIWKTKTETASRVRGRIEAVLDWAKARGYRTGKNPALWRGHIENLLPARSRVRKVKHHPALPYDEIGDFLKLLRGTEGIAARAFEFLILTAARTSEVIGALWDEVDLEKATWTIPAHRIKAGREHRVPLSRAAVAVLQSMVEKQIGKFVFPSGREDQPLQQHGASRPPGTYSAGQTLQRMVSAARFAIGRQNARTIPAKSLKWPLLTQSATRWKPLTDAVTYSKSGGG